MSRRAREIFGDLSHVVELVLVNQHVTHSSGCRRIPQMQFWKVWEDDRTVILGARPCHAPDPSVLEFVRLESRLVHKLLRLLQQERKLAERVRRQKQSGGGRAAIRLIEQERQRLGRELHTGVGQTLAAIRLQIDVIGNDLSEPPPRVRRALENVATLASDALEQVRSVSQKLHPPEWQRLTLAAALQQLWDLSAIPENFQGELRIAPMPADPDPEVKALIYRAMQEGLSNLVRHSKATRVDASLETAGEDVILTMTDNGVGFDVASMRSAPASVAAGLGIRSIREQVEGLGGKFDIESGPSGTKLVVSVVQTPTK
jgi:two-component system, NarL family, sensor kinase